MFDKVYLVAKGKLCYGGPREDLTSYFSSIGREIPTQTNPAEWLLELVDTDFSKDRKEGNTRLAEIQQAWETQYSKLQNEAAAPSAFEAKGATHEEPLPQTFALRQTGYLLHRNFIKSYRDLIAYWLRVAMYTGEYIVMVVPSAD